MHTIKTILIAFLLFVVSNYSYSQQYSPFPVSSAVWHVEHWHGELGSTYHTYFLNGDTTVDDLHYSKVYALHSDSILVGGIREDSTKKVYFTRFYYDFGGTCLSFDIPDTVKEVVLYDFGLDLGDTSYFFDPLLFPDYDCFMPRVVTLVNYISVFGSNRRRLLVKGDAGNGPDYWIEGVGSDHGLFGPYAKEFESEWTLCSFENMGEILVSPNPDGGCISAINPLSVSNSLQVYPNPSDEVLYFKFEAVNNQIESFGIYDCNGKVLLESKNGNEIANGFISVKELPYGIYIYSILVSTGETVNGKFVKQGY